MAGDALGPNTADVFRGFIGAVNDHRLDAAERLVDTRRYHENCVGFTRGFVASTTSGSTAA